MNYYVSSRLLDIKTFRNLKSIFMNENDKVSSTY